MHGLAIGSIQLDIPVVQAALSGYSDMPMRRLARKYGCPYCINEVVLDKMIDIGGQKMKNMLAIHPDEHPIGGQLMGSEPEQFARAAEQMVNIGYDAVDINFGCPVKKVLGRCRGGYLLSTPPEARTIIRCVCEIVAGRVPVTVKMRRGMDDSLDSERNFFAILDAAYELGCAAVTVHARTVTQRYVGPSRWSFLARVKRHVGDEVLLGSGDLFTAADCLRMIRQTGVNGVSIARGAIGNPFIFRELRAMLTCLPLCKERPGSDPPPSAGPKIPDPPSIIEQGRAIRRHYELMTDFYGAKRACVMFRKFGIRYSELHPCHMDVKMAFIRVKSPEDFRQVLERWYDNADAFGPVKRRIRPEALIAAGASETHNG